MDDDEVFEPEPPPSSAPSVLAEREKSAFEQSSIKPNSIIIPLWGKGHISFDPDGSVSIFAAIALLLLLIFALLITLAGVFAGDMAWLNTIFTALGHAITGVVGAIVGSSVATKDKSD